MPKSQEAPRRSSRRLRCAIYTRKSSDEGLEQAFNSLDAQREACAAFVLSQKHEGWSVLPTLYDDGGYSGGTLGRPALQRLLADIADARVDVVVVYKIDRLTRSLFDFAKIVEVFDAKGVSFVSITQQFNTTTSMGRLTLNVLLSFAQFEREVAGERIRDKIAASKKKGMWMGGLPPLGYDVRDRKLVVNKEEAQTLLHIFRRYIELRSARALKAELDAAGIRSKRRTFADRTVCGGHKLSRGALYSCCRTVSIAARSTTKAMPIPESIRPSWKRPFGTRSRLSLPRTASTGLPEQTQSTRASWPDWSSTTAAND
jgi:site-specific DNA recombinase